MDIGFADQSAEVAGIPGYNYAVFSDAPCKHPMVGLTASADVQRMNRIVATGGVQFERQPWRQAFVNEQPHAALTQGRPPGRPMSGWVRA